MDAGKAAPDEEAKRGGANRTPTIQLFGSSRSLSQPGKVGGCPGDVFLFQVAVTVDGSDDPTGGGNGNRGLSGISYDVRNAQLEAIALSLAPMTDGPSGFSNDPDNPQPAVVSDEFYTLSNDPASVDYRGGWGYTTAGLSFGGDVTTIPGAILSTAVASRLTYDADVDVFVGQQPSIRLDIGIGTYLFPPDDPLLGGLQGGLGQNLSNGQIPVEGDGTWLIQQGVIDTSSLAPIDLLFELVPVAGSVFDGSLDYSVDHTSGFKATVDPANIAGSTFTISFHLGDCNGNAIMDCSEPDCNDNQVVDECDITAGTSQDVNANGVPDECDDCNNNGIPDLQDIALGTSQDCNANNEPDDCDPDCDGDDIPDDCDVIDDCDGDGVPDLCDDGACCLGGGLCADSVGVDCVLAGGDFFPCDQCTTQNVSLVRESQTNVFAHVIGPPFVGDCPGRRRSGSVSRGTCSGGPFLDAWESKEDAEACQPFGLFGQPPIPAGFFEASSDAFIGEICLRGRPLGVPGFGDADTLIERATDPFDRCELPNPEDVRQMPIEIVALSLESIDPILVTSSGGPVTSWDVFVDLSVIPQPGASFVSAVKEHCNGGTYVSQLLVLPRYTFTKVGDPSQVRVLDTGLSGFPVTVLQQLTPAPWVHDVDPALGAQLDFCSGFHPGIEETNPPSPCPLPDEPGEEITCDDVLDNDCDGLTDGNDPDCAIVACPFTCGDIDGSGGAVNLLDFASFAVCFNKGLTANPQCICSDMNDDGSMNLLDFATFGLLFGRVSTNAAPNCL